MISLTFATVVTVAISYFLLRNHVWLPIAVAVSLTAITAAYYTQSNGRGNRRLLLEQPISSLRLQSTSVGYWRHECFRYWIFTVLLVRHAHTDMAGRFCGHSDPDLSRLGQQQLQEIVQRIGKWPFTKVYSSSLMRARRTAETLAASRYLEINIRSELDKESLRAWERENAWAEIEALYPVDAIRWLNDHPKGAATGGELYLDFQQRVLNEFRYFEKEAQNTCIAIVSHAGFIRTALVAVAGLDAKDAWTLPLEYGSITEFNYLQEGWRVNDIALLIERHPRFA